MTKDEAIKVASRGLRYNYASLSYAFSPDGLVDVLVALGVLTLEEPPAQSPQETASD